MHLRILFLAVLLALSAPALSHDPAEALYLGNEAVMVSQGETRILFDPLFRNDYGQYQRVPPAMEAALIAGEPPFENIDAVLVSHYHGDHFTPAVMLKLLENQPDIRFYGPAQATASLLSLPDANDTGLSDRIETIQLEYGDTPVTLNMDGLLIEAVRIPHAGWPQRAEVQNIVYRVTLDNQATVVHMGDADPDDAHFVQDAHWWASRDTHLAMPPYWFFLSAAGRQILEQRIAAKKSIGIHVPRDVPTDPEARATNLQGYDLFTRPGEKREVGSVKAKD